MRLAVGRVWLVRRWAVWLGGRSNDRVHEFMSKAAW